ncbi:MULTISPECIES: tetratricopeptide repeat protein [Streptomyces]|uniref:tetratricopeptide repeat protein n=1 Tax=Streptomyces TaxID=1883 RepID=UPI001CC25859|nr:tetratricopeptide repeat protein [Streptomyces venezuelae]
MGNPKSPRNTRSFPGSIPGESPGTEPPEAPSQEAELLWGEPVSPDQLTAAEQGYARCGPAERLLWERLSVFEGAFGREAVREVCASGTLPSEEIQAVLDRLAPLALLPVDDLFDGEDGAPRYWMPHPMRAVGARRLTARGDRWVVVLHHRRWCVKLARQAADWWQSGRQIDARNLALRELPDLAAAMDPTTAPLSPNAEADTSVEIAVSLWFLWVACGRVAEGHTRLRHALSLHSGPHPARALWLAAYLELESGRPEDADPLLVQAWAAAVRDGDDRCLGMLAHLRGATALFQGRTREAAAEFREALALMEEHPEFGPSRELCWVALALTLSRTDPEAAQEALDQAVLDTPARQAWTGRDLWADAWAHHARAELLSWDGERERAAEHARRALRAHLHLGTAVGAACAAELLAQMRVMVGRMTSAAHLLGAADLLRASVFEEAYRPAEYCATSRDRSEALLRGLLDDRELRRAYEEGARLGLFALAGEE